MSLSTIAPMTEDCLRDTWIKSDPAGRIFQRPVGAEPRPALDDPPYVPDASGDDDQDSDEDLHQDQADDHRDDADPERADLPLIMGLEPGSGDIATLQVGDDQPDDAGDAGSGVQHVERID